MTITRETTLRDMALAMIRQHLEHPDRGASLNENATLKELGIDTLAAWSIAVDLETATGMEFAPWDVEHWKTVADVLAAVSNLEDA